MTKRKPQHLHLPMGRPSRYEVEAALEIVSRMEAGEYVHEICRDEHLPAESTFWGWVSDGKHPRFAEAFERARQVQGRRWFEETISIADGIGDDPTAPQVFKAQTQIRARQWASSRIVPEYSERIIPAAGGRAEVHIYLPQKGMGDGGKLIEGTARPAIEDQSDD